MSGPTDEQVHTAMRRSAIAALFVVLAIPAFAQDPEPHALCPGETLRWDFDNVATYYVVCIQGDCQEFHRQFVCDPNDVCHWHVYANGEEPPGYKFRHVNPIRHWDVIQGTVVFILVAACNQLGCSTESFIEVVWPMIIELP